MSNDPRYRFLCAVPQSACGGDAALIFFVYTKTLSVRIKHEQSWNNSKHSQTHARVTRQCQWDKIPCMLKAASTAEISTQATKIETSLCYLARRVNRARLLKSYDLQVGCSVRLLFAQRKSTCAGQRVSVCVSVCLSVCLSAVVRSHYCTDPDVTWESGRGCPLAVHYWADLQSGHGSRCYGNITRTRNVSEYMHVHALCLVLILGYTR